MSLAARGASHVAPKCSTRACSSGHPHAPVFAASFSVKIVRRFMRCGPQGPVSWVGLSRPQEAAASSPRRLSATARRAIKSSTPSMETRRLRLRAPSAGRSWALGRRGTVMVLLVVLPLRGAAALDPWHRVRLRRKTSVSQLQDAHEPAKCDARFPGREDVYHEFGCAGALRELLQRKIGPTPCATRPD